MKPAQLRILDRAVHQDGTTEVRSREWPAAMSLHSRKLGTYHATENTFEINQAGRDAYNEQLRPAHYRDEPCEECGALATTGVSGKRLCHSCTVEILNKRLGPHRGKHRDE